MAYANHVTKQIDSYSVDSMALSLNVLLCSFYELLRRFLLSKESTGDNFLSCQIFFFVLSFSRFTVRKCSNIPEQNIVEVPNITSLLNIFFLF